MANIFIKGYVMHYRINLGREFSTFPFGRFTPQDGEYSGEVFREKHLKSILQKLREGDKLIIDLNDVLIGIGSSFLTESFGGAVKKGYITKELFLSTLQIICNDDLYESEIRGYIKSAIVESATVKNQ
jgi:hypothetical protein